LQIAIVDMITSASLNGASSKHHSKLHPYNALGILACIFFAKTLGCQPNSTLSAQPIAKLATDFTNIWSARELSDGRVLVSDNRERKLVVIIPGSASLTVIGRVGDGPGEYQIPTQLIAIGLDSTILIDGGTRRWLLLIQSRIVALPDRFRSAAITGKGILTGIDNYGNVFRTHGIDRSNPGSLYFVTGQPCCVRELALVRYSNTEPVSDTIAKMRGGWAGEKRRVVQMGTHSEGYTLGSGFPTWDQAAVFSDGRIAVVSPSPYSVDWYLPSGRRISSARMPENEVRVTQEMKRTVAEEHSMPGAVPDDFASWPASIPAFLRDATVAGSDGMLYIRRSLIRRADSVSIDRIDQKNKRESFRLPPRSRIVGVGSRGLYVALKDEDDVETLALYSIAPTKR